MKSYSQNGFTLVELLVALVVLSVLGVVLAAGVQQMTQWQSHLLSEIDDANRNLHIQSVLMNDLLQLAPRASQDGYGGKNPACLSQSNSAFECSRFDAGIGGRGLVRIGYRIDTEGLVRLRWSGVDRTVGEEPIRQVVMHQVDSLLVRWQDAQNQWQDQWPMPNATPTDGGDPLTQLPQQIELVLSYKNKEVLRMWFPISKPLLP